MNALLEVRSRNCEKIKRYNPISSFYKISQASKNELDNYRNE